MLVSRFILFGVKRKLGCYGGLLFIYLVYILILLIDCNLIREIVCLRCLLLIWFLLD